MAEFLLCEMNETPVDGVDSHAAVGLMASAPAASAMRDR
jgi:hypothetical protein